MKVERVVLDTNVLISAALSAKGKPAAALKWVVIHATLLTSAELMNELETRLVLPKFDRYMDDGKRRNFINRLKQSAELIAPTIAIKACRDPDDDKILEIAVAGIADCIVSGDKDLLVLDPFRGIPILTPAAFLTTVGVAP